MRFQGAVWKECEEVQGLGKNGKGQSGSGTGARIPEEMTNDNFLIVGMALDF